jgi:polyhydroxyalkanoate synthesis repressor PhaR
LADDATPPGGKPQADPMQPDKADKSSAKRKTDAEDRIVIKKYANRRLYNTGSSCYVTLEDLSDLVKAGDDFVVYDAKTGEDITRPVLTQIIFEAENSATGQNLLPIQFLRQLIQMYGHQMQSFVPSYLEMSLDAFSRQQERMREQLVGAFGGAPSFGVAPGFGLFDEQVKQNLALFDRAIKMFTPAFAGRGAAASEPEPPPAPGPGKGDELAALKAQMEAMRAQLEALAKTGI